MDGNQKNRLRFTSTRRSFMSTRGRLPLNLVGGFSMNGSVHGLHRHNDANAYYVLQTCCSLALALLVRDDCSRFLPHCFPFQFSLALICLPLTSVQPSPSVTSFVVLFPSIFLPYSEYFRLVRLDYPDSL